MTQEEINIILENKEQFQFLLYTIFFSFVALASLTGFILYKFKNYDGEILFVFILLVLVCTLALFACINIIVGYSLDNEIDQISRNIFANMECEELKSNILYELETRNSTKIDYQREYYHYKCQIPHEVIIK